MYSGPEVDRDARSPLHGSSLLHPPCEGEALWRMKQLSNFEPQSLRLEKDE